VPVLEVTKGTVENRRRIVTTVITSEWLLIHKEFLQLLLPLPFYQKFSFSSILFLIFWLTFALPDKS